MKTDTTFGTLKRRELQQWLRQFVDKMEETDIPWERLERAKEILEDKEGERLSMPPPNAAA